jgi:hypothetical protein
MTRKKYIIGVIVFLVLIAFGVFLILNKKGSNQSNAPDQNPYKVSPSQNPYNGTQQNERPSVQVSFAKTEIRLNQNQQHTSTLSFSTLPDPEPTAFTLMLTFDPSQLQVNDIEPGNLWTGENILQKDIDNEKGVIMYSAGQGFSDEVTGESQIAKITFTSQSTDTQIQLGPESAYTSVQEKVLIPMQGLPLTISVK